MEPLDIIVSGSALNDFGFEAYNTVEGLGLVTSGYLWPCAGIWAPASDPITTNWTNVSQPNTTVETCID